VYFVASAAVDEAEEGRKCEVRAWRRELGGDILRFEPFRLRCEVVGWDEMR